VSSRSTSRARGIPSRSSSDGPSCTRRGPEAGEGLAVVVTEYLADLAGEPLRAAAGVAGLPGAKALAGASASRCFAVVLNGLSGCVRHRLSARLHLTSPSSLIVAQPRDDLCCVAHQAPCSLPVDRISGVDEHVSCALEFPEFGTFFGCDQSLSLSFIE
jgi:hypothetical protein